MTSTGSAEIVQCPLVVDCGNESDLNLEKISQMMDCILKEFMRCVYVEAFKGYVLMKKHVIPTVVVITCFWKIMKKIIVV